MINIFDINLSYLENNYSDIDLLFFGISYAFSFALPFSPPLLISL